MSNFGLEPIEFEDFSGGETDFFLLGGKTRYEKAANYLVNANKKLEMRPGSGPFDWQLNHLLPGSPTRVGSFLTFNRGRDLLVQQAQNLYYLGSSWTPITGPEGAPAVPGSGAFDSFNFAEWNSHTYFTSGGGGRPGKIYRTPGGEYQVRTVGLPLPESTPRYTNELLLNHCISLANDIRASMVGHMSSTAVHDAADKWSLAYFSTQSWTPLDAEFPGPLPAPTPAPAATDEDTLYTLIEALSLAFAHHSNDVNTNRLRYHKDISVDVGGASVIPPKGPYKGLNETGAPETLAQTVDQLNELRQRWEWHRLGVFTHHLRNDYATINVFPLSVPKIENAELAAIPYVKSNYSEVIRYANYLKHLYNIHASLEDYGADFYVETWNGSHPHGQPLHNDQYALCTLPDATLLEEAFLIIYWVWAMYGGVHFADANIGAHTNTTMDTTAGSADVTDVGGGGVTLPLDAWVIATSDIFNDTDPKNRRAAQVLVSASGTATLSKTLVNSTNNQAVQYSLSVYHGGYNTNGVLTTQTESQVTASETPDPRPVSGIGETNSLAIPTTLLGWIEMASSVFTMLQAHMLNRVTHGAGSFPSDFLWGNGPFYKPEIATYSYAFVYKSSYTTDQGVIFQVESEPIFVGNIATAKQYPINTELETGLEEEDTSVFANQGGFVSTHVEEVASAQIYALPRLRNSLGTNYDVENVTIEIFRTQNGGNTYFLLGEVANGTEVFEDVVADAESTVREPALQDRAPLYTTGGEVAHTQAPDARFMHFLENTAYYGYIFDEGQLFPNRVIQSIPGAPDTGPGDFFDDLPDELVGLSSCRNNIIALCRGSLYRMTGGFNNLGQGALKHESISDELGCVSTKSIVRTKQGVFFAGTDGFYWTDGFQYVKLSIDRDESYAKLVATEEQASRIYGCYDPLGQRVWWSVQTESSGQDVDQSWIFHINYGIKPAGVFTSAANGTYWAPSAMVFHLGRMIRGDRRGVLFLHHEKYQSDPKIPTTGTYEDFIPVDQWGTVHVPYQFKSCAVDFGKLAQGNYVTKIKIYGPNKGNAAVQVNSIADNNNFATSKKSAAPMLYQKNLRWGDPNIQWGDETAQWKYDGQFNMTRRLAHGNLRAQVKQIEIVPARVGVYNYDQYPVDSFVDVDASELTVTLQAPENYEGQDFPCDVEGMFIAFESDDFEQEYEIEAWEQEVLHILDPDGVLTEDLSDQKWVIRGYMKEARADIHGFAIFQATLGERGDKVGGETVGGENAG